MLTSRKWEELDAFNAEDESAFGDQADDSESFGEHGASAAGRRGMIETALNRVREVARSPLEPNRRYTVGALVFDGETSRFGRIKKSSAGSVVIEFLSGGSKEISAQAKNVKSTEKAQSQPKPKAEISVSREEEKKLSKKNGSKCRSKKQF